MGLDEHHLDVVAGHGAQRLGGVGLVVLDGDDDPRGADPGGDVPRAGDDPLGRLEHDAVVAREERLALAAVDDDGVDGRGLGRRELDRRGERRAPHADESRRPRHVRDPLAVRLERRGGRVLIGVGRDGDGLRADTRRREGGRHGDDLSGRRRVHRSGDHRVDRADQLSAHDPVALGHQRRARRAQMLAHGDDEPGGQRHAFDGATRRLVLVVRWVHPTPEARWHPFPFPLHIHLRWRIRSAGLGSVMPASRDAAHPCFP